MDGPNESSAANGSELRTASPPQETVHLHREATSTIAEAAAAVADEALDDTTEPDSSLALDEASALKGLTEDVRDQDDLERDISYQANQVMIEQEDERDHKRVEKAEKSIEKLMDEKRKQHRRLANLVHSPSLRSRCMEEIEKLDADITALKGDISDIQQRMEKRHAHDGEESKTDAAGGNKRMASESQRDFLIRTGKITPFSRMSVRGSEPVESSLTEALISAEDDAEAKQLEAGEEGEPRSHQNLRLPGFAGATSAIAVKKEDAEHDQSRKRRRLDSTGVSSSSRAGRSSSEDAAFNPQLSDENALSDDEDDEAEADAIMTSKGTKRGRKSAKGKKSVKDPEEIVDLTGLDDGDEEVYQARLKKWVDSRSDARRRKLEQSNATEEELEVEFSLEAEWFKPCPDAPDHTFDNGLKIPGDIYPALFDYQKTGVQWLGELYSQQVGGIVGDEMGLGKTIQIISFLAALHYSKKLTKPVIVVAPATVLRQWVNEFHRWWPAMRVSILHSSGSGMMNVGREDRYEEDFYAPRHQKKPSKSQNSARKIVDRVVEHGHVLVTTYSGLQTYRDELISVHWGYAVLDEGHKIRNPNTAITIYCKELRTPNRVILSGTPMQNNLIELWSLFDFVFPMRLGTLVDFRQAFEVPIKIGGYASASNLQVLTATKCAETLKAAISPYLLQRLKVDVASDLPKKSEQVLFCKLTKPQREAYEMFLASDEMSSILTQKRQSLYGIDILRKICNHPDLLDTTLRGKPGYKWGNPNKSGKMQVVKALLGMWKQFGHKTLLFSQGVLMLNVIEDFIKKLGGFNYLRMDGSTSVKDRQTLVDRFNNDPDLHVFLLTTKVGGLGVNLTGANRVIIFDPDWNPSTDIQARERAWRLGQKKEVTIYRLMTAGTIEEKIYHRQIFKQFLTNKIMKDPTQRQTFQMKDLHDLFTLGSVEDGSTETSNLFQGTEVQFKKDPGPSRQASLDVPSEGTKQGDSDVEVRGLAGVANLETFKGDPADEKPASEEDRIMEGIFARSVHSALEHDQIINGKQKITADRGMIEREAKRVAAEAAVALRKAGEIARGVEAGTVTWTGEYGSAGRPGTNRRGAPSSSSILSGLANQQGHGLNGNSQSVRAALASQQGLSVGPAVRQGVGIGRRMSNSEPRGKDFMKLIQTFMKAHNNSVPSQSLITHFSRMCKTDQQSADFKAMLNEIAVLEQGNNSRLRGVWVLKEEFR